MKITMDMDPVSCTTTTRLNLRTGPGTEYPVIEVLKKGSILRVLEDMGGWLNVETEGRVGFVDERYVRMQSSDQPAEPDAAPDMTASLSATTIARVNLREGPGLEYGVIHTLPPGTRLDVFEELGRWLNVYYAGRLAYIHADFVRIIDDPVQAADSEDRVTPEEAVETYAVAREVAALRTGPGEMHDRLAILGPGEEARVLEDLGDWLNVLVGEHFGYVREESFDTAIRTVGITTTILNMRGGPGTQYAVLNVLPKDTQVEVLEDLDGWLDVRYEGVRGYVHGDFVRIPDFEEGEDLKSESRKPVRVADLKPESAASEPPPWEKHLLAAVWARYKRALDPLAGEFGIEPGAAASVLAAETALEGFGEDGRLLLRFENHIFWDLWGQERPEVYDRHFRFDPEAPPREHAFRVDAGQRRWTGVHTGGQAAEWTAYELAAALDLEAARRSVRMGLPQIPGYRHAEIGYGSAGAMMEAFSADVANQIRGLFALIAGPDGKSRGMQALRRKDFYTFAGFYNGESQGAKYGALLEKLYGLFE